ncbi:MAG: hypothetical protein DCF31_05050 [Alphaproteobacteria bacterium]|nr:MAG: hypothetical protein DCF31_05050 [Alphaproteobacteria bacterium]
MRGSKLRASRSANALLATMASLGLVTAEVVDAEPVSNRMAPASSGNSAAKPAPPVATARPQPRPTLSPAAMPKPTPKPNPAPTPRPAPQPKPAPRPKPELRPSPPLIDRPVSRPGPVPQQRPPVDKPTAIARPPYQPPRDPLGPKPPQRRPAIYPPIYGNRPPPPWYASNPRDYWSSNGFAGHRDCSTNSSRLKRCSVNTINRVVLARRSSNSPCVFRRTWGYDSRSIWVSQGCRGRFAYGYGSQSLQYDNNGWNTGAAIAGIAISVGLIAILASSNNRPEQLIEQSATLIADTGSLPPDARRAADMCLVEAARQVGATGGTEVRLDAILGYQPQNSGYLLGAQTSVRYPGNIKSVVIDCETSNDRVSFLEFR